MIVLNDANYQAYNAALANDDQVAAADAYDKILKANTIVFQNAKPGTVGNYQPMSLTGTGRWNFDLAMSKSIEFMEGKTIDFRVDAQNIFNHATTSGSADTFNKAPRYDVINQPLIGLNSNDRLGHLATKAGHRTFQAKMSIRF
jgi:hypothetical protein